MAMECYVKILHYGPHFPSKDVIFVGGAEVKGKIHDSITTLEYMLEKNSLEIETRDGRKYQIDDNTIYAHISSMEILGKNKKRTDADIVSYALKNSHKDTYPDICRVFGIPLISVFDEHKVKSPEFDSFLRTYGLRLVFMQNFLAEESNRKIKRLREKEASHRSALNNIESLKDSDTQLRGLDNTLAEIFEEILTGKRTI